VDGPVVAVGSVAGPAIVLAIMAIRTAAGPDSAQNWVGYANPWWWNAAWLLVVPLFVGARRFPRLGIVLFLCAAVPQFVVAAVVSSRYSSVGGETDLAFGDLGMLLALGMTVAFGSTAALGWGRGLQ
jgi:hypothetical protein